MPGDEDLALQIKEQGVETGTDVSSDTDCLP